MSSLPRWMGSDEESVRREVAPYRAMDEGERLRHLAAACRAGARMLAARADRARVLAWQDPLSDDTRQALARLRAKARAGHGRSG